MSGFTVLLGEKGLIILIGIVVFLFSYRYSVGMFTWIEDQTFGTRNYILEKLELLFIQVKEEYITYTLLTLSVGLGLMTLGIFGLMGNWIVGFFLGSLISFIGFKIPKPIINNLIEKRIRAYTNQMVDALTLLSNGIRAGLSVNQSLDMVVREMPAPISEEFGLVLKQNNIGVPLEEAFDNLAARVPTEDNDMFVSSMNILRETGGNLAEVFDTIVGVIRERVRLQQKFEQLTASGMFQGYTIAAMPFLLGIIFAVSDPATMSNLVTTPVGWVFIVLALVLDFIGLFFIMKIVKIKM